MINGKNIVECKICGKDFEYILGFAGNRRQWCDDCRDVMDAEELEALKEYTILENNRYLNSAPGHENKYDASAILVDGEIPEFENSAEMFVCTVEVSEMVRRMGIAGTEKNIVKFLKSIDPVHRVVFLRKMTLQTIERMASSPVFNELVKEVMKLAV